MQKQYKCLLHKSMDLHICLLKLQDCLLTYVHFIQTNILLRSSCQQPKKPGWVVQRTDLPEEGVWQNTFGFVLVFSTPKHMGGFPATLSDHVLNPLHVSLRM